MNFFYFALIASTFLLPCQDIISQKMTITGHIKSLTEQNVVGATILIKQLNKAVVTSDSGRFSMVVKSGKYTLAVVNYGYKDYEQKIKVDSNSFIEITLVEDIQQLDEVKVEGKINDNVENKSIRLVEVDLKQMKKLPAIFGQVDVTKSIQMMPGVQVSGEGSSGFYVRGGSADQNLILLDHAPIYYSSHLFGIFSVFNSDILKSVALYKGGIPPEYGGRLSSVLDIQTKDDMSEKINGSYTSGTGIYQFSLLGPIKSKTSYMISARRSIIDIYQIMLEYIDPSAPKSRLYFYDINLRLNHEINIKNKLSVSFYNGRDYYNINNLINSAYTNTTGTLNWKHIVNEKFTSNSYFTYSRFAYNFGLSIGIAALDQKNGLEEWGLKQDFKYFPNTKNSVTIGVSGTYRNYKPREFTPTSENSMFKSKKLANLHSGDLAVNLSNAHKISSRILLEYGLRISLFSNLGKGDKYIYQGSTETKNIVDTIHYNSLQSIKAYAGLEPRISGKYLLNENNSIKFSYDRMIQYMHLLSNSTSPVPQNIWIPSNTYIYPQKSNQLAIGYFKNLFSRKVELSLESYYKHIGNALDFKDNARIDLNPNVETQVRRGSAWSYGAELYVKAKFSNVNTSVSYTWSKSLMKGNDINQGKTYYASYDRRNSINFLCSYDLNERWNIAGNFVYASGRPMTLPAAKYNYGYVSASYYTQRNGYRMPDFHHLDVALNYYPKSKLKKRTLIKIPSQRHYSFSLYNVYGRKNTYFIYTRDVKDVPNQKQIVMVYLFRWIPSLSVEYKF